jgi:LPXTG-motif cell wall-anchored protein
MKTQFRYLAIATTLAFSACSSVSSLAQKPSSGPTSTVVYVSGNDLVVKASDGRLLNYNVAGGTKFSAGGKDVSLSDLKPGTKLTKEVATGFDPDVVSSVQVVTGKVFAATPPDVVSLSLADGIKELTVPTGTKFMVDGSPTSIDALKAGATVTATVVTTVGSDAKPEVLNAKAPATPALSGVLLVAKTAGDSALPEAGTNLPLYGIAGLGMLMLGFGLMFIRRPARS